ncbi:MAG: CBS domain-containing protein [Actinomycetota bacterium]
MSPRAAWRLETLGFTDVYDYTDGKLDWLAAGLPVEGRNAHRPRAGDVARRDVPTCTVGESVDDVRERVERAGWDACVVVDEERVVFGLLRAEQLASDAGKLAGDVMRPGPSTFRPHVPIEEMAHYMVDHDLPSAPVTTSDGRLVGLLTVQDAAQAAHEQHAHADEAPQ